jgi:hypothetical protein
MLPSDVGARKKEREELQRIINSHLTEQKLADCIIPYSDKIFRKAAIEWLIATDQVCHLPH